MSSGIFMLIPSIQNRLRDLIKNISKDFAIDKMSKSPARFSIEKLRWFNRQYIQMMSLEEFSLRSFVHRINKNESDKNIRVGDYVLFVDLANQQVFCTSQNQSQRNFGGKYYLIGGGRKDGEIPMENLVREVGEETYGKVSLDTSKVKKMCDFRVYNSFEYPGEGKYDGRELNVYFYELSKDILPSYELDDVDKYNYNWIPLADFITESSFISYPIWKNFCQNNNIKCFEPTKEIKYQYLAWNLDKNRITTLSEFGSDSNCVLDWEKPENIDVKWKKSTEHQSIDNLREISPIVIKICKELAAEQNKLLEAIFDPEINHYFSDLSLHFETHIKDWLKSNQKDTGSYLWPLRVALSGKQKSPSPFELLAVMPIEEVEKRLKY